MLTLLLGRAGTGKTAYAQNEIKRRMAAGETGLLLIVPEQYSHDAERQLCSVCGDRLSLHGETLSFTRLCGRVFAETGGAPARMLDGGGQILAMYRALESVQRSLKVYGANGMRLELLEKLLGAVNEFKALNITPLALMQTAEAASSPLDDKLRDLSVIFGAYDAILHIHGDDAADRLSRLADMIAESSIGEGGHIFFDGFNDFTAQELRIIGELLRKGASITVCLTCGSEDWEAFELPRETSARLRRIAEGLGAEVKTIELGGRADASHKYAERGARGDAGAISKDGFGGARGDAGGRLPGAQERKAAELAFLEKHLFSDAPSVYRGENRAVTVYSAPSRYVECEYAAYKVRELVREGYRWRDIGVMARNWEEYRRICENVFEKYDAPFFSSGRADISDKPPVALIDAALEIAVSGWEYKPVFRYLKTGLSGFSVNACSELENYVLMWNIRGAAWTRDWNLPPSGYGGKDERDALARINGLRRSVAAPLVRLSDGLKGVTAAGAKLEALYGFLREIELQDRLAGRAEELRGRSDARLADEYIQIWDVIINAMEQMSAILGDSKLDPARFRKLAALTLSQYDVGVVPVSLDRTALGSMEMSRRRDLKCLIVLGATDDNLPMLTSGAGVLSDHEREELARLGMSAPAGLEERLSREMNIIYSAFTLPSRQLVLSYPGGAGERPSFIIKRLRAMFRAPDTMPQKEEYMTSARTPCFELAALAGVPNEQPMAAAARRYFSQSPGDAAERLREADIALRAGRGSLSERVSERLYGLSPALSASRADKYYSCAFAYFLRNGLRLNQRVPAGFDAPAAGVFMHYVLEGVSREIKATVGFKGADELLCKELTARYIAQYTHDVLLDFEGVGARFRYLFNRLEEDVLRIILDMLEELKRSDFSPLDFEFNLAELSDTMGKGPDGLNLKGIVDRVDGFVSRDKLYLRVVDYKTGKKTFSLSDVFYGRDMQMLIYLFALQKYAGARYGGDITPAGVLYAPARDVIVKASRNLTDDEIRKLRERELRRDGLILDDPIVIDAMEHGDEKKYLPLKLTKDGSARGDSLASTDQFSALARFVGEKLRQAASEIRRGDIDCSPYYKNAGDNACLYCEYGAVCGFDETGGDRRRFLRGIAAGEVWERFLESAGTGGGL